MEGLIEGLMDGVIESAMDGLMDGLMEGAMDGWNDSCFICRHLSVGVTFFVRPCSGYTR